MFGRRDDQVIATVPTRPIGLRDQLEVDLEDGTELKVHAYGVQIAPGRDDAPILANSLSVEDMSRGAR